MGAGPLDNRLLFLNTRSLGPATACRGAADGDLGGAIGRSEGAVLLLAAGPDVGMEILRVGPMVVTTISEYVDQRGDLE